MSRRGEGEKQLWPYLRYHLGSCLKNLRETTEEPQLGYLPDEELDLGPPAYQLGILSTRP